MPQLDVHFPLLTPQDCLHENQVIGFYSQKNQRFFHLSSRTQLPDDTVRVRAKDIEHNPTFPFKQQMFYEKAILKKISTTCRASQREIPFAQDMPSVVRQDLLDSFDYAYVEVNIERWGKFQQIELENEEKPALSEKEQEEDSKANSVLDMMNSNEAYVKHMATELTSKLTSTLQWMREKWWEAFKRNLKNGSHLFSKIFQMTSNSQDVVMSEAHLEQQILQALKSRIGSLKTGMYDPVTDLKTGMYDRVTDLKTGVYERATNIKEGVQNAAEAAKLDVARRINELNYLDPNDPDYLIKLNAIRQRNGADIQKKIGETKDYVSLQKKELADSALAIKAKALDRVEKAKSQISSHIPDSVKKEARQFVGHITKEIP